MYALATRVPATRTVQLLIGRADDCWGETQCPQFHAPSAGPAALSVSVAVPWRVDEARITLQAFRDDARNPIGENDIAGPPPVVSRTLRVSRGRVLISIPQAGDGDAFYATVSAPHAGKRR